MVCGILVRALLVAACLASVTVAHPDLYVRSYANGCLDHPTTNYKGHAGPTADPATEVVIQDAQGNRVLDKLCPGAAYSLTINFPEPRQALVTSNAGSFLGQDPKCPGRWVFADGRSTSLSTPWAFACNYTGGVQLKVTSATGGRNGFQFASMKLQLADRSDTSCTVLSAQCFGTGAAGDIPSASVTLGSGQVPSSQLDAVMATVAARNRRAAPAATWSGLPGMDRQLMQWVHNILMLLAFAVLMPLGALLARHKWMFGRNPFTGKAQPAWYYTHITCQLLAVVCAVGGLLVIILTFGWKKVSDQVLYDPHKWMGLVIMGMSLLQVVVAPFRPKLESAGRPWWNLFHWNWGRITVLAGMVNTVIGSILVHKMKGDSYLYWLLPVSICLGLLIIVGLLLEAFKLQYERTLRYESNTHVMHSVLDVRVPVKDDRTRLVPTANSHGDVDPIGAPRRDQYAGPHGTITNQFAVRPR